MTNVVHTTSVVSPNAQIGEGVVIGPYCVIEPDVEVGDGSQLLAHVVLHSGTRIGRHVRIHPGAVIGGLPQDLKFGGEDTIAIVGDRTIIRECVTINRGTAHTRKAEVGKDCLIMAYSHIAHDCVLGDNVIIANSCQLGGHVVIEEWAILGGLVGIHQFCRVGAHSMIAASTMIVKDVPPYTLIGRDASVQGLNSVGLRRRGFAEPMIAALSEFYDFLLFRGHNTTDGIRTYEASHDTITKEVAHSISFVRSSNRGIHRA